MFLVHNNLLGAKAVVFLPGVFEKEIYVGKFSPDPGSRYNIKFVHLRV